MSAAVAELYPIQVVAHRTGLSADVIRAWERRYGAVRPHRSETRRRLYSDDDVLRLDLLHRAVRGGRRIGDVAGLDTERLLALLQADRAEADAPTAAAGGRRDSALDDPSAIVDAAFAAVAALDCPRLASLLESAAVTVAVPTLLDDVVTPLMRRIGDGWRDGRLRVCHEHAATLTVRRFLWSLEERCRARTGAGPVLVLATPPGQLHDIGIVMAAVAAAASGWTPLPLGSETPAHEVAHAALATRAPAVAIGITYPADDPALARELRLLRDHLPVGVALLVGGAGAGAWASLLADVDAHWCDTLQEFGSRLDAVRAAGPRD